MPTIQVTLEDCRASIKQAMESGDQALLRSARTRLEQWLLNEPAHWAVLFYLGTSYIAEGRHALAMICFEATLARNAKASEAWANMGVCYRAGHHVERAEEAFTKALELTPNDASIYNNLATLHVNEGTPDVGLGYLDKALELNPGNAEAHWNRGLCLLELERWGEGFQDYSWGLVTKDRLVKFYGDALWWDGDAHPSDTICVYGEQGIGDEIMFASQIPDLREKFERVIIDCHPRLESLFRESYPWAEVHPTRKDQGKTDQWSKKTQVHWRSPMGGLGRFLRKTDEDFPKLPYIQVPQSYVDKARKAIAGLGIAPETPLVGVSWVGGYMKTRKDLRHVPISEWQPIFDVAKRHGAEIISLQYTGHDEHVAEAAEMGVTIHTLPELVESKRWEYYYPLDAHGKRVPPPDGKTMPDGKARYWTHDKEEAKGYSQALGGGGKFDFTPPKHGWDYGQTAGLVQAIAQSGGSIVSINTSLVHLCGAMGVECLTLTPSKPAWRYGLQRKDMIWYPEDSVRQFRQAGEDWTTPVRAAAFELDCALGQHVYSAAV